MLYKLLKVRYLKFKFADNKNINLEAALVQSIPNLNRHEIVFIDEIQINNRK